MLANQGHAPEKLTFPYLVFTSMWLLGYFLGQEGVGHIPLSTRDTRSYRSYERMSQNFMHLGWADNSSSVSS